MFEFLGIIIEGFLWLWILIIAAIPGIFMVGLKSCIAATAITYFTRKRAQA